MCIEILQVKVVKGFVEEFSDGLGAGWDVDMVYFEKKKRGWSAVILRGEIVWMNERRLWKSLLHPPGN